MRRITLIVGFLLLGSACSDSEDPSVSEAPQTSEREETPANSTSYVIDKAVGLAVEVLVEGNGPVVRSGDLITVHYRGTVLASSSSDTEALETDEVEDNPEADAEENAEIASAEGSDQEESDPVEVEGDSESAVEGAGEKAAEDVAEGEASEEVESEEPPIEDYVFGDTFKHGIPLRISLQRGSAIEGWRRGLIGLRVGSRVVLLVSSELAYGEAGMPSARIPENADLRYEIELLDTGVSNRRR